MTLPLSDIILLAVSFTGFGILTWTIYKLMPPKPKPRRLPNNDDNNNRTARRRRQRMDQRRNNRRRATAGAGTEADNPNNDDDNDDALDVNDNNREDIDNNQQNDDNDNDDNASENENNEDGEVEMNIKNLTKKERIKAQKRAEREERRRYEEQRREELSQKKEEEEQEYLERRERVYEEMENERLEEERKLQEKLNKERREYEYWKKMFVVVDESNSDYHNYENEMCKMKDILLEYLTTKNHIIDLDNLPIDEFGITNDTYYASNKEIKEILQQMINDNDIFGVFDDRNRFVYFSSKELNDLADCIQNYDTTPISVSNLLHEIERVSSSNNISV